MKSKHISPPTNPRLGQLYFDPPTSTMRAWNGKRWEELSLSQMQEWIGQYGSLSKYYEHNQAS